jgi:DNA-binding response OmpR family regulator
MGQGILLIGCSVQLRHSLATVLCAPDHQLISLPDLHARDYEDRVAQAALIILHESVTGDNLSGVCRQLRRQTTRPVLVLAERGDEDSAIAVLGAGADDFLAPAISLPELVARIRANLRRDAEYTAVADTACYELSELTVDVGRREVTVRHNPVTLTPKEFDLIRCLAAAAGRPVRREDLLAQVWGYTQALSTRTLDVHVGRLRRKLEREAAHPQLILTVPGVGYKLAAG